MWSMLYYQYQVYIMWTAVMMKYICQWGQKSCLTDIAYFMV
jgi:hypothetical protein